VEKHRQALMDKLDIHEIATLTRYAVYAGIVDLKIASHWPVTTGLTTAVQGVARL
jgi:hypothetical protein